MRQAKYHVEVRQVERSLPTSKEALENLKGLGAKTISRMRKEAVDCPVLAKPRPFIECFACESFIRRARSIVDCEGPIGDEVRTYPRPSSAIPKFFGERLQINSGDEAGQPLWSERPGSADSRLACQPSPVRAFSRHFCFCDISVLRRMELRRGFLGDPRSELTPL